MSDRYTRVLEAIVKLGDTAEAKRASEKLIDHLKRHGRVKLLPDLLHSLKAIDARHQSLAPIVEVAHQHDAKNAISAAEKAGIHASHAKVNHELLSGWRAQAEGKLVDHSGKGALVAIYQKVTS